MCRTCRHIDPSPSFVFIGPPPSRRLPPGRWRPDEGSPGRPPPPAPGRHPQRPAPPPSDRPAQGGTPGHPRHGISSAKNGSDDFGGLKIDPQNRRVFNFCTKRYAVYFWTGIEKIKAIERILRKIFTKKHEGRAESAPPFPVRVLRNTSLFQETTILNRSVVRNQPGPSAMSQVNRFRPGTK